MPIKDPHLPPGDARSVRPGEEVEYHGRSVTYDERITERRKLIAELKAEMYAINKSEERTSVERAYRQGVNDGLSKAIKKLEGR